MDVDLLGRVLPASEFPLGTAGSCPVPPGRAEGVVNLAAVTDRTDPPLVHPDGRNPSREWHPRRAAAALSPGDPALHLAGGRAVGAGHHDPIQRLSDDDQAELVGAGGEAERGQVELATGEPQLAARGQGGDAIIGAGGGGAHGRERQRGQEDEPVVPPGG